MPELPEVETISQDLNNYFFEKKIINIFVYDDRALKNINSKTFIKKIKNTYIKKIYRYGKSLIWELSNNLSIHFHLRMTGKFVIGKKSEAKDKHCMVSLEINNDILNFIDVRKFATIHLLKTSETNKHSYIKTLGVDPVLKAFTNSTLKKLINTSSKMNIKSFLLDQSKIAGIGNIYASEILFKAKISPLRINNTLNEKEILNIYKAIKNILAEAIISRGTTFSDYRDGFNRKGSYQNKLRVYNKYNEACQTCGTLINKIKQNGRSTFYCSNCQK